MIVKDVILMKVDSPNLAKRMYPREVVEKALTTITTPILGTLGHPAIVGDEGTFKLSVPTEETAAFISSNFKFVGDYVVCDIKTLDNAHGILLSNMLQLPETNEFYPHLTVSGYTSHTYTEKGTMLVVDWEFLVPYMTPYYVWG